MGNGFDLRWVFAAFCLAVTAYAFYTYYHKTLLGRLVRALLEVGAHCEEDARSFAELGVLPSKVLLRAVCGGALSRVVSVTGLCERPARRFGRRAPRSEAEIAALRLYVPEESRRKAQGIYAAEQSVLAPILVTVATLVLTLIVCMLLPHMQWLFA